MSIPFDRTCHLLLLEDRASDAELLRIYLSGAAGSFELTHHETVGAAVAHLEDATRPVDVVFVDLDLPDGSGLEVLRALRQSRPDCAFIVLTGRSGEEQVTRLLEEGAQDYIRKRELSPEVLRRAIEHAMARHHHRELERELEGQRRVAMIGKIVGALSHQLNNPMGVVLANNQFVQEMLSELELRPGDLGVVRELRECVTDNAEALSRMRDVLSEITAYARIVPEHAVCMSAADLLEDAARQAGLFDEEVEVYLEVEPPQLELRAARQYMLAILSALLRNAHEACEGGARPPQIRARLWSEQGEWLRLRVEDNGSGMSREVLSQALDPFFSTDPARVGLGLTLARQIALSHGGALSVETQEGQGTLVRASLRVGLEMGRAEVPGDELEPDTLEMDLDMFSEAY